MRQNFIKQNKNHQDQLKYQLYIILENKKDYYKIKMILLWKVIHLNLVQILKEIINQKDLNNF